jgi:glutaredoxin
MEQKRVRMYTLSTCSHCMAAKQWMKDHNIEFDYTDVDLLQGEERKNMIREVREYNPNTTFPTIIIGDEVIIGTEDAELKKALGLED